MPVDERACILINVEDFFINIKELIEHMIYSQPKQAGRFWTSTRLALTALTLTLVAAVASSCGEANETANSKADAPPAKPPTVSIKSAPATNGATTSANPPAPVSPNALQPMPESVMQREVKLLDGTMLKLEDYKGKVLVVDIWATWCGPCRQSIPHLVALREEFKPEQLEIIGLTTEDPVRDDAKVRAFAQQFSINYKIAWVEDEMAVTLMRGRNAIPQALVITKDGRLLRHMIGFSPESSPKVLRDAVEQAMNMPG